jgi:hypothetical protein
MGGAWLDLAQSMVVLAPVFVVLVVGDLLLRALFDRDGGNRDES